MNGTLIMKNCEISKMQKNEMDGENGTKIDWYQCLIYQDGDMNKGNVFTIAKEVADKKYCGQYLDVVIRAQEDSKNKKFTKFKIMDFLKDGKSVQVAAAPTK